MLCDISSKLIFSCFRLPQQVGNIAKWTEEYWEMMKSNEYQKSEMELSSLCISETRIILPEMNFHSFTKTCRTFQGQPMFIEDKEQVIDLMSHGKCSKLCHFTFQNVFLAPCITS